MAQTNKVQHINIRVECCKAHCWWLALFFLHNFLYLWHFVTLKTCWQEVEKRQLLLIQADLFWPGRYQSEGVNFVMCPVCLDVELSILLFYVHHRPSSVCGLYHKCSSWSPTLKELTFQDYNLYVKKIFLSIKLTPVILTTYYAFSRP